LSSPSTSSWTNAPVSFCVSQGAVVSQARNRTITSPTRSAWPGFIVRSRAMPLRLLSSPITATRCAIGVSPRTGGAAGSAFGADDEAALGAGVGVGVGAAVDTGAAVSF
jgi:hypothetical protein